MMIEGWPAFKAMLGHPSVQQAVIFVSGAGGIWLSQDARPRVRRLAPWVGLLGQPLWLIATWSSGQLGMLLVSLAYTAAWLRGIVSSARDQRD
jgi:hypothetical protein